MGKIWEVLQEAGFGAGGEGAVPGRRASRAARTLRAESLRRPLAYREPRATSLNVFV